MMAYLDGKPRGKGGGGGGGQGYKMGTVMLNLDNTKVHDDLQHLA